LYRRTVVAENRLPVVTQELDLQFPDQQLDDIFEQYAAGWKMEIADDNLSGLPVTGEWKLDDWCTGDMQMWMASRTCPSGMPLIDQQFSAITIENPVAIVR